MVCKEFEKNIPIFLQKNMDYKTMYDFQEHMKTCEACKEELSIQFLVGEGLQHLEDGEAFDYQKELNKQLLVGQKMIRRFESWHSIWSVVFIIVCVFFSILTLFYFG